MGPNGCRGWGREHVRIMFKNVETAREATSFAVQEVQCRMTFLFWRKALESRNRFEHIHPRSSAERFRDGRRNDGPDGSGGSQGSNGRGRANGAKRERGVPGDGGVAPEAKWTTGRLVSQGAGRNCPISHASRGPSHRQELSKRRKTPRELVGLHVEIGPLPRPTNLWSPGVLGAAHACPGTKKGKRGRGACCKGARTRAASAGGVHGRPPVTTTGF